MTFACRCDEASVKRAKRQLLRDGPSSADPPFVGERALAKAKVPLSPKYARGVKGAERQPLRDGPSSADPPLVGARPLVMLGTA